MAGKEDKTYEGEALGRKMAIVFFEEMHDEGLGKKENTETLSMQQELLNIAEVLQTVGIISLPPDPERTTAQTELLLESHDEHIEVL